MSSEEAFPEGEIEDQEIEARHFTERFLQDKVGDPLFQLRKFFENFKALSDTIQAYIIPNHDEHMSEYLADKDKRLRFITNFTGSAGTAVIIKNKACLWTDPRYFIQATNELNQDWKLMKMGIPGTLTEAQWLGDTLPAKSKVAADPKLLPYPIWVSMKTELEKFEIELFPLVSNNLVDLIWGPDKPQAPLGVITPQPEQRSGMSSSEKLNLVRNTMKSNSVDMLIITSLDEIAWILNLRGNDIPYNPVFFAFLVIMMKEISLFVDEKKITLQVRNHFNKEDMPIGIHSYNGFYTYIGKTIENDPAVGKVWLPSDTNYWIYQMIPPEKRFTECSPIALMKAIKNNAEVEGMISAHIKDGVALCQYFNWLENEVSNGVAVVTEIEAAKHLEKFRKLEKLYVGPSFETISACGPHAAIAHYTPSPNSDRRISKEEIYLCDAGAQFLDGTTDVSRTMHFGEPSAFQKQCFTRVFKGLVNLTTAIFPSKVKGNTLDTLARKYLWDVGLDYGHGTGHGIGAYLNVHEGPMGISWRPYPNDPGLQENMFLSNEPGFYAEGEFGIRIENIVQIVPAEPPNNFQDRGFLTFKNITVCPIQTKMIDVDLLTDKELEFLNRYNNDVREKLGPILKKRGIMGAYCWLEKETFPVVKS